MHVIATVHGLPVSFAITGAKADERTVVLDLLQVDHRWPPAPGHC